MTYFDSFSSSPTNISTINAAPLYVTTGEPAGIGPDIALQAVAASEATDAPFTVDDLPVVLLGDRSLLEERAKRLGLSVHFLPYPPTTDVKERVSPNSPRSVFVLNIPLRDKVVAGQLNSKNAEYVLEQLQTAAEHVSTGKASAIVTGPVQKSIINDAGIPFTGHTEFFQHFAKVPRVVMMLATDALRVALATTHLPLRAVADAITQPLLREIISILVEDLQSKFGIQYPKILVCGLNPHAGESGHMGREEIEVIDPVLAEFRAKGVDITPSLPADTLFTQHYLKDADAVLAMYHDQGLPVLKHAGFGKAVNITLGLPFIRTSVDHGTALSLAGTGLADAGSLETALKLAAEMVTKQIARDVLV